MTTLVIEGFENYTTSTTGADVRTDMLRYWSEVTSAGTTPYVGSNFSRWTGEYGYNMANIGADCRFALPSTYQTVAAGCAIYLDLSTRTNSILGFYEGGNSGPNVRHSGTGYLQAYRGSTLLGTSSGHSPITSGSWHYVEMKTYIHDTAGTFEIWLDGIRVYNGTGLDTKPSTNAYMDNFFIGGRATGSGQTAALYFDDVYCTDGEVFGDCRVKAYFPNGAGATTQWTKSGGSANYEMVDDVDPDDDSTYNYSSTATQKDTFALPATPAGVTAIHAVRVTALARKDDAATREIALVTRSNGTDYESGNFALGTTYVYLSQIRDVDPDTSADWTTGGVDAMEVGYIVKT